MNARSVPLARHVDINPGELALFEVAGRRSTAADGRRPLAASGTPWSCGATSSRAMPLIRSREAVDPARVKDEDVD